MRPFDEGGPLAEVPEYALHGETVLPFASMFPDGPAVAEGALGQTPFAHLAAYALDKRITGEIFLCEPGIVTDGVASPGPIHVIRFEGGMPTKIRMGNDFARLGELLLAKGAVTEAILEGALATHGGLLGDILVLSGYVESALLEDTLVEQFKQRMTSFYALPPETQFKYFDKSDTLAGWGGDPSSLDPFSLLWAGIEAHGECSLLMESTLALLQGAALKLHGRAPYQRFCLSTEATDVVELIALDPTQFEELLALDTVPVEVVRKVLYTLVITRQLDLGKPTVPVGVEERPATVAKVALRSTVHRQGAAAPDAPGDGERTPVRPISIRRGSTGTFEVLPREEDPSVSATPTEIAGPASPHAQRAEVAAPAVAEGDNVNAKATPNEASKSPDTAKNPVVEEPADIPPDADLAAESSQKHIISDAIRGMPTKNLIALAIERIEEKELQAALEVCRIAREADPESSEVRAVAIWARSLQPGADLKVFSIELDESLREDEQLVVARFVRGVLRKRLSEDSGALADFRKVLEIDPTHVAARRELALLEPGSKPDGKDSGFLKRLFRR